MLGETMEGASLRQEVKRGQIPFKARRLLALVACSQDSEKINKQRGERARKGKGGSGRTAKG